MSKNSIEEDIKKVENYLENSAINDTNSNFFKNGGWETVDLEIPKAMQHILADYKKVLKENRKPKSNIVPILINNKMYFLENSLYKDLLEEINKNYILKAQIKEILEKTEITNYNKLVDMFLEIKKNLESEE